MDLDKVLQFIPDLLLYFVPGFISLRIKETYGFQKKHEELGAIIYSILYSFIVLIIFTGLKTMFPFVKNWFPTEHLDNIKRIVFLALGVLVGAIITTVPKMKWWAKITGKVLPYTSAEQSVWEKAMTNSHGAKAQIFLKDGKIYEGDLAYATGDPDDQDKAILLFNFTSYTYEENENGKKRNQKKYIKRDYAIRGKEDEMERVYIKSEDILAVEIFPNIKEKKA